MIAKPSSAIFAVTALAVFLLLPAAIFAQDCLDYGEYMHWVAALGLETATNAVTIADEFAYMGKGYQTVGALEIIDISTPEVPLLVGTANLPGYVRDVVVRGDHAYVAAGWAGLRIVDVSDPTAPIVVGSVDTPEYASYVDLHSHYAVVAEWNTGRLHAIDVTNPAAPVIVGGVDAQDDIQDLVISDGFAYVIYRIIYPGTAGLQVFDLTDPELPVQVADLPVQDWAQGLSVVNSRAYVVSSLLEVVDVTNPAAPAILGSVEVPHAGRVVVAVNDHAYVGFGLYQTGLAAIDVSVPEFPVVTGVVYTRDEPRGLAVSGSYAYQANTYSGLNVIDISVPASPPTGVYVDSPVSALSVAVAGQYAYLAGFGAYEKMQVIDIADPPAPVPLGTVQTPGVISDIAVAGQYAYAADDSTGLHVIDVSDPNLPEIIDVVDAQGIVKGVATTADYLYATYVSSEGSLLRVMDIATPSEPLIVGSVDIPSIVGKLTAANGLVYVVNYTNMEFSGLTVVDATDPTEPVVVGMTDPPGHLVYDVVLDGTVVYLAGALLQMIDVGDPSAPIHIGSVVLPNSARGVAVHDHYAYVAVKEIGLVVVDVTDPIAGFIVGIAAAGSSPSSPNAIACAGDYVYVAGGPGLNICLRQCNDVVPIFCADFTVTCTPDVVYLQWSVTDSGTGGEFQLVGRQADHEWHVPYNQDSPGHFSATDDVAGWVSGQPRTYSLYYRTADADWLLLAAETVEPVVAATRTGLQKIQPNPFNPHTSVSFTVERTQHVTLAVYDLSGRRVAVLVDRVCDTGDHTTHWDGRDGMGRAASSGTYVVRFETDRQAESRKIMLVR